MQLKITTIILSGIKLKYPSIFLSIVGFLFCCGLQRGQEGITQEEILYAYANEFIDDKNEYIYYKSKQEIKYFKEFIGVPFSKQRIQEVTKPKVGINLDSLITTEDIKVC